MVTLPEIVHPNPSLRWRLNPPRIQTQRQSGRCEQADENQDCEDQSGEVEASGHHPFPANVWWVVSADGDLLVGGVDAERSCGG